MIFNFFFSEKHRKLWQVLKSFKKDDKLILVIKGKEGTGKTETVKRFLEKNKKKAIFVYLPDCNTDINNFTKNLVENLSIFIKTQNKENSLEYIDNLIRKSEKKIILVCDNLKNIDDNIFNLLIVLAQKHKNKLKLILITKNRLNFKIPSEINYQSFELKELSLEETVLYLLYLSKNIKNPKIIFDEKVYKNIYKLTKGNIKRINELINRIITTKDLSSKQVIISPKDLKPFQKNNAKGIKILLSVLFITIGLSFIFGYYIYSQNNTFKSRNVEIVKKNPTAENQPEILQENKQVDQTNKKKINEKEKISQNKVNQDFPKLSYKETFIKLPTFVFEENNFNSKRISYLEKSDKVFIIKENKDWLYILSKDKNIKGWIPKYAIKGIL